MCLSWENPNIREAGKGLTSLINGACRRCRTVPASPPQTGGASNMWEHGVTPGFPRVKSSWRREIRDSYHTSSSLAWDVVLRGWPICLWTHNILSRKTPGLAVALGQNIQTPARAVFGTVQSEDRTSQILTPHLYIELCVRLLITQMAWIWNR